MKIILPVGDVPEGEVVTKVTGAKQYIVRKSIIIRQPDKQVINSSEDVVFLVPYVPSGTIDSMASHKEVAWDLTLDELQDYVREQMDLRDGDHK